MDDKNTLFKNKLDRWQFGDVELTCGDVVEIRAFDQWLCGRIEATPKRGYFLLDPSSDTVLELKTGLMARIPQRV